MLARASERKRKRFAAASCFFDRLETIEEPQFLSVDYGERRVHDLQYKAAQGLVDPTEEDKSAKETVCSIW